jgi:hypothetical protein
MNLNELKAIVANPKVFGWAYYERFIAGDGIPSTSITSLPDDLIPNLIAVAEAAEITNATLQGYAQDEHFTIKQLATWDGPVVLREAIAKLKAGNK